MQWSDRLSGPVRSQVDDRGGDVARRLLQVRLQVRPANNAFACVQIDQDEWPVIEGPTLDTIGRFNGTSTGLTRMPKGVVNNGAGIFVIYAAALPAWSQRGRFISHGQHQTLRSKNGTVSHGVKIRLKGHGTESAAFACLTDARVGRKPQKRLSAKVPTPNPFIRLRRA